MNLRRIVSRIIPFILISPIFIGCGQNEVQTQNLKNNLSDYEIKNYEANMDKLSQTNVLKDGEKVVIGFSIDSLKEPIWKANKELFVKKATELGAEVRVEQANSDDNVQLSQIDKLIAEGVNVLVIAPHDGEKCGQSVEKAHKAGIKVIAYDRLIKNSDVDLYVAIDNYKVGVLQGEEMMKNVSSGNIAYVGGSPTDNNAILFRQGALDVLSKNNNINIVMDEYSTDWKAEAAYNNVFNLLSKSTDVQGIVCANDGTASGAIAALEKFNMDGTIPVTGLDSELAACQRIVEGKQLMTVYKPTSQIAQAAAECAVQLAKGESVKSNSTINNGKIDVQAFLIDPVTVTKENMMDIIIKDKFHSYEEVYKNIPENERPKK